MAQQGHTFGPTCAYYQGGNEAGSTKEHDGPPAVKAQFFYISALPIDDPLSPLPPTSSAKLLDGAPPQPFSIRDNAALEEAWQDFRIRGTQARDGQRPGSRGLNRMFSFPKFQSGLKSPEMSSPTAESSSQTHQMAQAESAKINGLSRKGSKSSDTSPLARSTRTRRSASMLSSIARRRAQTEVDPPVLLEEAQDEMQDDLDKGSLMTASEMTSVDPEREAGLCSDDMSESSSRELTAEPVPLTQHDDSFLGSPSRPETRSSLTGRPFARAPSTRHMAPTSSTDFAENTSLTDTTELDNSWSTARKPLPLAESPEEDKAVIPVGISRLHLVELPEMHMKPIYWNPINDISTVMRATWFYKDTMMPLPADVANRLEIGYEDMKPYSSTYQDELNACVAHGAAAEIKVVHPLWSADANGSRPVTAADDKLRESATTVDDDDSNLMPQALENAASDPRRLPKRRRLFETSSVIYIDPGEAQILRPNVLPSVSRNRKPLNAIRRGRQLGIAVVRGFDRQTWHKLYPNKAHELRLAQAKAGALMSQSGTAATAGKQSHCTECDNDDDNSKVSDLVLVVHGIGQKLSERMDSYHFTHAINGLRREFNVELANESVRSGLKDHTGIMVLPINWRLTVNFDDSQQLAQNRYDLKDVTPETLPAVRSIISDVMLDIPYYLSHHKQKMISAVIREANRVYRLWCRNNPGFQEHGRVHLIAHSLGSVMAMEILSHQPTYIPQNLDLDKTKPDERNFEFNTTNLFCCGSPCGFFLLLNGANLVPRKGRSKAGMEGEDAAYGVAADAGTYGCLAVDNIYNICHRCDPIAYQQNACVDRAYAAQLQPATLPNATQSFFYRLGNSLRWTSTTAPNAYNPASPAVRPTVASMPSTVELETHNFSREEIAEKRMFLLNENGQIDYFLNAGGGPLEIQYLNMLSAHSSYWILPDFIRFLVVEIGRKPGKAHTLPALRAAKKREYKRGVIA